MACKLVYMQFIVTYKKQSTSANYFMFNTNDLFNNLSVFILFSYNVSIIVWKYPPVLAQQRVEASSLAHHLLLVAGSNRQPCKEYHLCCWICYSHWMRLNSERTPIHPLHGSPETKSWEENLWEKLNTSLCFVL